MRGSAIFPLDVSLPSSSRRIFSEMPHILSIIVLLVQLLLRVQKYMFILQKVAGSEFFAKNRHPAGLWQKNLSHWCPAQMYCYFLDSSGGQWCIYLRGTVSAATNRGPRNSSGAMRTRTFFRTIQARSIFSKKEHPPASSPAIITKMNTPSCKKSLGDDGRTIPRTGFSK